MREFIESKGAGDGATDETTQATCLAPANIRKHLRALRSAGLVLQHGGPGARTIYERVK